ncbi:hypothetical protein ACLBWS_03675 [Brucellaceae bacterium D45D]
MDTGVTMRSDLPTCRVSAGPRRECLAYSRPVLNGMRDYKLSMVQITIYEIYQLDWNYLRDYLAGKGWAIERGGDLDHSWANLSKGDLQISMEYDIWSEGQISFDESQKVQILVALPKDFLSSYCVHF